MIVLVIYPILQIYAFFGVNLANIVTGGMVVYGFFAHKYSVKRTLYLNFCGFILYILLL